MRRPLALLGVFALAAAAACAPTGGRTLVAEFADVGDLVTRADVQQSDADVGTVTSISLVERDDRWIARVEMALEEGTPVPVGTRALIRSTSLLGEKFLALIPPEGAGADAPQIPEGGVIGVESTGNVPELEEVFRELGALLASGALQDLGAFMSASALIVEGQEQRIGDVLDGTARLVDSLHAQREAIAAGLDHLASAAGTLAGGTATVNRFLGTSEDVLGLLAAQRSELADLVVQLDRLAEVNAELIRNHRQDVDAQIKAVLDVVPKVFEVRDVLMEAVEKLPPFIELFARAAPGDYVQLDILVEGTPPIGASGTSFGAASPDGPSPVSALLWRATR